MPLSRRSQQAPRQARSFKSVLTGFGLFFCSLLICLGAIELAMRAGGAFLLWRQAGHRWNGSAASGAKPVLRILCIGESTTGPKEGNDWPHQLYEILSARRTGLDVQVNL